MLALAPIGAATYLGGSLANAYGQDQALSAMRDVWGNARAQQSNYDNQLMARASDMVHQVNPQAFLGQPAQQQLQGQMDDAARNALAAMQQQGGRRAGNAEGKAVLAQRTSGLLTRAMQDSRLAAILHGLQSGNQNIDMLGRNFALDSSIIRGDAQRAASLIPMYERAAAMRGSSMRQLGQVAQMGGMFGMMAGMASPEGGAASGAGAAGEIGPAGGPEAFAQSSQYAGSGAGPSVYDFLGR